MENDKGIKVVNSFCPRKSVGIVIKDDNGRFLCLYRKGKSDDDPTKGLVFPAGHLDWVDEAADELEAPEAALVREAAEELGIEVISFELLRTATLPNLCSAGYDGHYWWIYLVNSWNGLPKLMEQDKHDFVKFLHDWEIKEFVDRKDCDPAWSEYIWPMLEII